MKPVRNFVDEILYQNRGLTQSDFFAYLRNHGYIHLEIKDVRLLFAYDDWCNENYPDDYFSISDHLFFTNKEIAALMKLSVL